MSEFIRKIRYFKYGNNKCKKYLRLDFSNKCAYCFTNEAEIISGHKYFEIDHFKPQSLGDESYDVNQYENLFYSCKICNGPDGKSGTWDNNLLNPCEHVIYGVHISKELQDDFKLIPLTLEGVNFLNTFKLNQKNQRKIRHLRFEYRKKLEERAQEVNNIVEKLRILKGNDLFPKEVISSLEELVSSYEKELVGPYYNNITDECFEISEEQLLEEELQKICEFKKLYHEFDIDYLITLDSQDILCYHRIIQEINFSISQRKHIRISTRQAIDWFSNIKNQLIALIFSVNDRKLYAINLNKYFQQHAINTNSQYYIISFSKDNLLLDKTGLLS